VALPARFLDFVGRTSAGIDAAKRRQPLFYGVTRSEMEPAAALITIHPRQNSDIRTPAVAGASDGTLLARSATSRSREDYYQRTAVRSVGITKN